LSLRRVMKVIGIPDELEDPFEAFQGCFTSPGHESMRQLTTSIIACSDKPRNLQNLHAKLGDGFKKSRTAYEYFLNQGKWRDTEVARRKAELFYDAVGIKSGDTVLLIIDDTHKEKKGKATAGVGSFFDHSKGGYIWGNNFVTSVIQHGSRYIPHIARLYLKEEDAKHSGDPFRTKLDIATEDIVKPFSVPEGVSVVVVFDTWWDSEDFILKILSLGYHAVYELKTIRNIALENGDIIKVPEIIGRIESWEDVEIRVRGRKKRYLVYSEEVEIDGMGKVRLIVSKTSADKKPRYFATTDLNMAVGEALAIYENRWNIETAHRESNQKLGFKDYQLRNKIAIERFIQLVFLAWTIVLVAKLRGTDDLEGIAKELRLSELIDNVVDLLTVKAAIKLMKRLGYDDLPERNVVLNALTGIFI